MTHRLVDSTLRAFSDDLASDRPVPGGGSASAYAGALGAALAAMVAILSYTRKGFESKQEQLDVIAKRGQALTDQMLAAVDADTAAFDKLLDAMRMSKDDPARDFAIADATVAATEVPLAVLEKCAEVIELCREVGRIGLQASLSDAGVGAQMARAAAAGAYQNVCINLSQLTDRDKRAALLGRADAAWKQSQKLHTEAEREILQKLRDSVTAT